MGRLPLVLGALFAALIAVAAWASVEFLPRTGYFPHARFVVAPAVEIEYFLSGQPDAAACEVQLSGMRAAALARCPGCTFDAQCQRGLSPRHEDALQGRLEGAAALGIPAGYLYVRAANVQDALAICRVVQAGLPPAAPGQKAGCAMGSARPAGGGR